MNTVTALAIKNSLRGTMRVEPGLRFRSNGDGTGNWQCRYTIGGTTKAISLGQFPEVSLKSARELNIQIRAKVRAGIDPKSELVAKSAASTELTKTFEEIAVSAFEDLKHGLKRQGKAGRWWSTVETHVLPQLGKKQIATLTGRDVADAIRPIWQDRHPTAEKALNRIGSILQWAEANGYSCDGFAAKRARIVLGKSRHRATNVKALDYEAVPAFYAGLSNSMQNLAFKFYILTLPRASNAVTATWDQIKGQTWHLPADGMKRAEDHHIPLSSAALSILDQAAKFYDGRVDYIFKNPASWKTGHVSYNGWTQQMRRHGLEATAHGMRASFKMWATLNRIDTDTIIEEVLHHKVRGKVEVAYMRGHTAELRRPMMEKWAAYVVSEANSERACLGLKAVT